MSDTLEPMSEQIAAHESYLEALRRLHDAEGDETSTRRLSREVERTRTVWHRLAADSERAQDARRP